MDLVARETFATPQLVKGLKAVPDRKEMGKAFKQQAKVRPALPAGAECAHLTRVCSQCVRVAAAVLANGLRGAVWYTVFTLLARHESCVPVQH